MNNPTLRKICLGLRSLPARPVAPAAGATKRVADAGNAITTAGRSDNRITAVGEKSSIRANGTTGSGKIIVCGRQRGLGGLVSRESFDGCSFPRFFVSGDSSWSNWDACERGGDQGNLRCIRCTPGQLRTMKDAPTNVGPLVDGGAWCSTWPCGYT